MTAIISEKGQVTIPKKLRDELGLKPGTVLQFKNTEGKLVASKKVEEDVFEQWRGRGRLPLGCTVDEYLNMARHGNGR